MRQGKEISSVKNSIQTRLSGVMLLVLVFALGINVFIFKQIHTAVTRIDAVFSSNTAVNELSESLEQVESTVYEYLNTKSTQALENYYRYEQNYKNLIEELNDRNLDNEVKMLEKNIRRMSESYLEQTIPVCQDAFLLSLQRLFPLSVVYVWSVFPALQYLTRLQSGHSVSFPESTAVPLELPPVMSVDQGFSI